MSTNSFPLIRLGDLATVTSGGTPNRGNSHYWNGKIPWVTTGEITFNTIFNTKEHITELGLNNSSAKIFPKNTLLIAMYGQGKTRGQVAKLGIEAATNQASAALLFKDHKHVDFYYQYLCFSYDRTRSLGNEGAQKNLNAKLIQSLKVPFPSTNEISLIPDILSTWDKAIEITGKLVENRKTGGDAEVVNWGETITWVPWFLERTPIRQYF